MTRDSKGYWHEPFAGYVHDFATPPRKRMESRKHCGPYCMRPGKPGTGLGFYMESDGFEMARHGARTRLRIESAGMRGWRGTESYAFNEYGDSITPIVARLPRGRGFLAGWTMGAGMCAELDGTIYADEDDARRAAHSEAESAADRQAEFEAIECERLAAEDAESDETENA